MKTTDYKVLNTEACSTCFYYFCPGCNEDNLSENTKDEIRQATRTLMNHANSMENETKVANIVAQEIVKTHRTIQQLFTNSILRGIIELFVWQLENKAYDARNEESCKMCVELKEVIDKHYLPYI